MEESEEQSEESPSFDALCWRCCLLILSLSLLASVARDLPAMNVSDRIRVVKYMSRGNERAEMKQLKRMLSGKCIQAVRCDRVENGRGKPR